MPLPQLANTEISYNGWTFAGPRVSTRVNIRPVLDRAGRTVSHDVWTLQVNAIVTDDVNGTGGTGADAATNIGNLHARLSVPGGRLVYKGLGHGDFQVNTEDWNRDLMWGPKTTNLDIRPIVAPGCFEVDWTLEVAIRRCPQGTSSNFVRGILGVFRDFSYSVDYSIDGRGLTTRTISGEMAIALNRTSANATTIPYTADQFRELLRIYIPGNFKRTSQQWRLSEDKSTLSFTITDTEMPSDNAYPPGVVEMDMQHRVSISRSSIATLNCTLSGFVEVAKPFPVAHGYDKMLLIARERVAYARATVAAGGAVLLGSLDVTENIFQRRFDFSLNYIVVGKNVSPATMIQNTGLFRAIQATSIQGWQNSLLNTAWSHRGAANLKATPASDRIIDQCAGGTMPGIKDLGSDLSLTSRYGSLTNSCPSRNASYLDWKHWIDVGTVNPVLVHWEMPRAVGNARPTGEVPSQTIFANDNESVPNSVRQTILAGKPVTVVLRGHAVRFCYPIEKPCLVKKFTRLGFRPLAELSGSTFTQGHAGVYGGLQVFAGQWNLVYEIKVGSVTELDVRLRQLRISLNCTDDDPQGNKAGGQQ